MQSSQKKKKTHSPPALAPGRKRGLSQPQGTLLLVGLVGFECLIVVKDQPTL